MKIQDLKEGSESSNNFSMIDINYNLDELEPLADESTMDLHYNTLYKNYVTKANKTGDDFQIAGAELHSLWFSNINPEVTTFSGPARIFILDNFGSLPKFKKEFMEAATTIQGNGWAALQKSGKIIQIPNHKSTPNIVLILDMWEHAFIRTWGADKAGYVDSFWKVIDWDAVTQRIIS